MIETPEIVQSEALTVAKIHQVIPASQIRTVMGKTLNELKSAIEAQGKTITGPWFTHHLRPPSENFDFEVCFPISAPITPEGRMQPDEWPSIKVARTVYRGGYEGLSAAWEEFTQWSSKQGHDFRGDIWERYLEGPESSQDPSNWKTELNRPLALSS